MTAREPSFLRVVYPSPRWALGLVAGAWAALHLHHLTPIQAALLTAASLAAAPRLRGWLLPLGLGLLVALPRAPDAERVDSLIDVERPVRVVGTVRGPVHGPPDARRLWLEVALVSQRSRVGARGGLRTLPLRVDLLVTLPNGRGAGAGAGEVEGEGDAAGPPIAGSRLRLRGHLGRLRASRNPGVAPDGPWTLRLESWRFVETVGEPGALARRAAGLRSRLESRLEAAGSVHRGRGAALARALVLGDASWLPERWRRGLRASGAVHVLAVSGLHVGLVAVGLWFVGGGLAVDRSARTTRRWARTLLCLVGVGGYLLLVGPRPSVLRATAMTGVALGALLAGRPPVALHGLALAAIGLVAARPAWVDDLGFRLSLVATLALLVVAPPLAALAGRVLPRVLAAALGASTAAQLATAPLLRRLGGGVHPTTPLLDLALVPWLAMCLVAALLWALGTLAGLPANGLLGALEIATRPLEWLADAPASGWRRLALPAGTTLALGSLWLTRSRRGVALGVAGAVLLVSVVPGAARPTGRATIPRPIPELVVLDVGQGDALLLRDGRRAVLVDGGGWRRGDIAARILLPSLDAVGVRRLDAVVLTHPDRDHCDGLAALGHSMPTGEVWAAPGWEAPCAAEVLGRRGRRWRPLWRGETVRVGRWTLETLWPPPAVPGDRDPRSNDRSLVLRASVDGGGPRLLLTGDIERQTERALRRLDRDGLRAEVLKVAHHGSKTSTDRAFLRAVDPTWALISAGRGNRHGHPHPDVVRRLEAAGARVLRTDRDGQIVLRWRAEELSAPGAEGSAAGARRSSDTIRR